VQAVVYERYGKADVLELKETDKPVPSDDEVLVKVHAISINDWDWGLLTGTPLANRMGNGFFKPRKYTILGSDIAGQVEAVGKKVTRFKPGDNVFGDLSGRWGGFAEYACPTENMLAHKAGSMTFEQAAAIPQAGMLAVQGLIDKGEVESVKTLLINGAGGGVGTFAVQIAKQYDIEVTGVDRTDKLEMMRSVGFDHVIDYTKDDFTKQHKTYDLILDQKTNRPIFSYLRALEAQGTYVTTGGQIRRLLQAAVMAPLISAFSKKKIKIVILKPNKDLAYMSSLFKSGKMKPVLDGSFTLNQLPEAMRYYEEGKHKGKVIIKVI
jgi:NADPH:quinone reductase-like Zn-dependent oxidoreductase